MWNLRQLARSFERGDFGPGESTIPVRTYDVGPLSRRLRFRSYSGAGIMVMHFSQTYLLIVSIVITYLPGMKISPDVWG